MRQRMAGDFPRAAYIRAAPSTAIMRRRGHNEHTMAQDSDVRLRTKRKATVKLAKLKAAAEARGEKPKGKRVVKKKA